MRSVRQGSLTTLCLHSVDTVCMLDWTHLLLQASSTIIRSIPYSIINHLIRRNADRVFPDDRRADQSCMCLTGPAGRDEEPRHESMRHAAWLAPVTDQIDGKAKKKNR
jgi:hypothetical protein